MDADDHSSSLDDWVAALDEQLSASQFLKADLKAEAAQPFPYQAGQAF